MQNFCRPTPATIKKASDVHVTLLSFGRMAITEQWLQHLISVSTQSKEIYNKSRLILKYLTRV